MEEEGGKGEENTVRSQKPRFLMEARLKKKRDFNFKLLKLLDLS